MGSTADATSSNAPDSNSPEQPSLKRVMGPGLLLLFIVGDILGTGIYALTGKVANQVGGAVWLPFLVAFVVAIITAFSYLELVTKFPKAAGAALYTHKAFGVHFLTYMVAFAVMCSGITSASTASRAFAANFVEAFDLDFSTGIGITLLGLGFMTLVGLVNFRGVSESVKTNVVLTCVELSGLLIIIMIGLWALGVGDGDFSRVATFDTGDRSALGAVVAGTALAFFAMVGFEDSVNMAEECKEPSRIFPKVLLTGLIITGCIYVFVSITAIALVPVAELGEGDTPLLKVVQAGAPGFPIGIFAFITMFAVANTALINMLMASRLLYGMSREGVLPPPLGKVHATRRTPYVAIVFTTILAFGLITFVGEVPELGGTTALLLLGVFTIVNITVLVLRKQPVEHKHFRVPTIFPIIGALTCGFLVTPFADRPAVQYQIAGVLLGIGVVLWAGTVLVNKRLGKGGPQIDPEKLAEHE
ncbi:APC family cationic amino acid transporter [Rhodococcus opacus PD630]|uniref:APC family permease n=1 Tax=Rhodococcus opacus TaxID=37919 RepID=UPI00029CD2E9|nr:APC family permease [Rhodococcus opacus]AHK30472.1 putative amino acid permease YfnA [Rhodococcus opacus PD630]EHI46780.1 APC family cationic amino acid transporter [Rhodococcus opacus PD630]KXF48626.1 amino acid permease [Rhodococcus sp. SC4]UDH00101.1 APC family permease [Rhodococcus opacus PD630]